MKKELECAGCDNYFVISYKSGDPVTTCPFCGESMNPDECNEYDDVVEVDA